MRRFLLAPIVLAALGLATGPAQATSPRPHAWTTSLASLASVASDAPVQASSAPVVLPTDHVSPERMQCLELGMQRPGDH